MPTLFRRKSTATVIEESDTDEAVVTERRSRSYTPSKRELGMLTPKRGSANIRRPGGTAAKARGPQSKGTARQRRQEEREAMMRGEEWALLPRDRGADRALVRDLVDSRRNLGSFVFGVLILVVLLSLIAPGAALLSNFLFLLMILFLAIDSLLLSRRIKRLVTERLPGESPRWRQLYFYGILRSTSFRFLRVPRARVKPGDKI